MEKFVMPSGVYKGKTVAQVHARDPHYLVWARVDHPDEKVRDAVAEFFHEENLRVISRDTKGENHAAR